MDRKHPPTPPKVYSLDTVRQQNEAETTAGMDVVMNGMYVGDMDYNPPTSGPSAIQDLRIDAPQPNQTDASEHKMPTPGSDTSTELLADEEEVFDPNALHDIRRGVWTKQEHERFLEGLKIYPNGPWRLVAEHVATRTVRQTMTHAQKYRQKAARRLRGLRTRQAVERMNEGHQVIEESLIHEQLRTMAKDSNAPRPMGISYSPMHYTATLQEHEQAMEEMRNQTRAEQADWNREAQQRTGEDMIRTSDDVDSTKGQTSSHTSSSRTSSEQESEKYEWRGSG